MEQERKQRLEKRIRDTYGDLLKKAQVEEILSISPASLNRLLANSEISCIKLGKKASASVRFEVEDVVNFISSNYVQGYHS